MDMRHNELFGIRRCTILIISVALAIGSFSTWKALGGGSATAARISVSGTALAAGGDKSPSVVAGLQTEPHSSTVKSPAGLTTASLGSAILTNGHSTLTARTQRPTRETVFNLEVHRSHAYHVSGLGVLAHHSSLLYCTKTNIRRGGSDFKPKLSLGASKPAEVSMFSKSARGPELMRLVLQGEVAALVNMQSVEAVEVEVKR